MRRGHRRQKGQPGSEDAVPAMSGQFVSAREAGFGGDRGQAHMAGPDFGTSLFSHALPGLGGCAKQEGENHE